MVIYVSLESNKFRICQVIDEKIIPITISNKLTVDYKSFNLFENTHTAASNFYSKFIENIVSEIKANKDVKKITLMLTLPIIKTGALNLKNGIKKYNCQINRVLSPTAAMGLVKAKDLNTFAPDDDDTYILMFFDGNSIEVGIFNIGDGVCMCTLKVVIPYTDNRYITDDYIDFINKKIEDEKTNIKEIICFGDNSSSPDFIAKLSRSIGCTKIAHLSSEDSIIEGLILQQKIFTGELKDILLLDCLTNSFEILINNKRIPLFGYGENYPTNTSCELKLEPSETNEISIIEVNHRFEEKIFHYIFQDVINTFEVFTTDIDANLIPKITFQNEKRTFRYFQDRIQEKTKDKTQDHEPKQKSEKQGEKSEKKEKPRDEEI